jgi:hypothetical protein
MGIGTPELIILWLLSIALPITVAYFLIKAAVRNGVLEALRTHELRRDRGTLGSERNQNPLT